MTAPQGGNINTQQHEIERAHTNSAGGVARWWSRVPALRGAVGPIAVALASCALAVAAGVRWSAPEEVLAAAVLGLVVALCLGVAVGVRFLMTLQSSGRRDVVDSRWPGLGGTSGATTERPSATPSTSAGCPVAHGSGPDPKASPDDPRRVASAEVDPAEAEEFLRMFHAENPEAGPAWPRIAAVLREIETTGTYWHTPQELAFGARVAWRNNARCIGRLYWRSLQVRDLRTVSDAAGVAWHCVEHLRSTISAGKIRPTISVFAPERPDRPAPRIWNEQLIRYAGYEQRDGGVLGDPRYVRFTRAMILRGWRPPVPRGAFDVLPLVVETAGEGARLFSLPDDAVQEVELVHPELDWFADLGVRWHAVPVISNNRLVIGGVSYPTAPFNGWYMGTEIGARNLGDRERYDLVPVVARRLGLDTSDEATLWRDRALVEINRAVLHSFNASGVSITDHHTEAGRFLTHLEREERAGRRCPADWSWIVPPMSGSQTPVFHRYYDTEDLLPNFFPDEAAAARALHGGPPAFD